MGIISHVSTVITGLAREKKKAKERSPHWATFRKAWLKENPACAGCGSKMLPQVHHVESFHEHPEKELLKSNVLTLCMWRLCHLHIGHKGNFEDTNENVRQDAAFVLEHPELRKRIIASILDRRKPTHGVPNDGPTATR